jgi:predicted dehydrogenase
MPKLEMKEALGGMARDFINATMTGSKPIASYESGLNTIRILEAAQISIKEQGREVAL